MIKSKYRWDLPQPNEELVAQLAEGLGVSRLVAGVLANRNFTSIQHASEFLQADHNHLLDPFLMKGMAEAVERITRAVQQGEKIRVYGDYDADGVTSTALMIRLLTRLEANFDTYIPHRSREGYGLNNGAIDLASDAGVQLLVTVDNGISAARQIAYARQLGIDVVVTDHHEPPEVLPEAIALVNPKQKDCPYPFKGLCGAGVVFKLAHAILGQPILEYADLAAIGTIADLMPLIGENRVIARLGLEQMRRQPIIGIQALAKVAGVKTEELNSGRIGFSLAPRLNAGGRLEHADTAVKLLVATGAEEADQYAAELDRLNSERQELVNLTLIEADEMWLNQCEASDNKMSNVIVLAKEGWNAGIAGLVASKLVERYYRPVIILALDKESGLCKGSARSIDGFDLYEALTECAHLMEHYGGHQAAAGMTIAKEKVEMLAESLHLLAEQWLSPEDWQPKRRVDLNISLEEASLNAIDQLAQLEPFGNGNPTPRIVIPDVTIRESRTMGKENNHLRMTIEQLGRSIEVVAFGMGGQRERLAPGMKVDLVGELSVNEWNGNRKVQLMFHDHRSMHIRLEDRRNEENIWDGIQNFVRNREPAGSVMACASKELYTEATARFGDSGIQIRMYSHEESMNGRSLILLGLPSNEQEVSVLKRWLAPETGIESLTIFSDRDTDHRGVDAVPFPEREHFKEVYAMCCKRGSWLDSPDGFLQETALKTEWPLATIRFMHEVFIELGFIKADGATRKIARQPPRRELMESARYRKSHEQATERRLKQLTADQLHQWVSACHCGK